jgi:hypothetical protein
MRISSKVVVPPPCQRKSQAMTNTIGSDSEMQRFESFHYPRAQARGAGPSRRSSRRKIGRLARPWRRTGPFAPRGDLGGLPLSQLAQGSSDMSF